MENGCTLLTCDDGGCVTNKSVRSTGRDARQPEDVRAALSADEARKLQLV